MIGMGRKGDTMDGWMDGTEELRRDDRNGRGSYKVLNLWLWLYVLELKHWFRGTRLPTWTIWTELTSWYAMVLAGWLSNGVEESKTMSGSDITSGWTGGQSLWRIA